MTENPTQGAIDPTEPVNFPPIIHEPDSRADVDRKKSATTSERPRKFSDCKKIRKKNDKGLWEYEVNVVSARYDKERQGWMYTLTDWQGKPLSGETEETRLCT